MQEDLAHDVRHVAIIPGECPLEELLSLGPSRGSVFAGPIDVFCNGLALALLLDFRDFLAQLFVLFALFPDLGPVLVPGATDDVDGPFTERGQHCSTCLPSDPPWIGPFLNLLRAISLKVLDHGFPVFADRTIVYSLSSSSKQQQVVELEQQLGTRLMDSRQDRLIIGDEFTKKTAQVPGALPVKATGGFIQEEQQTRLCSQFDYSPCQF